MYSDSDLHIKFRDLGAKCVLIITENVAYNFLILIISISSQWFYINAL